jgi:hypothetical protein
VIVVIYLFAKNLICSIPIFGQMLCPPPSKDNPCGSISNGGPLATGSCCANQNTALSNQCSDDPDPAGCRMNKMAEIGCTGDNVPCPNFPGQYKYIVNINKGEK